MNRSNVSLLESLLADSRAEDSLSQSRGQQCLKSAATSLQRGALDRTATGTLSYGNTEPGITVNVDLMKHLH